MNTSINNLKFTREGEVCVDSGQILIVDPCYIDEAFAHSGKTKYKGLHYLGVCRATHTVKGCGEVAKLAFATSSGGDGSYPVYVARRNGRIASIRIDFITDD